MGMPAQHTDWTADMARALPDDGKRYEVLEGELCVSPAPDFDHQFVVLTLAGQLERYVTSHALGWVLISPADVEFSPRRLVQPDVFVASRTSAGRPRSWRDIRTLSLVVEVLSPSTARADRTRKRSVYQSEQIPEYWIVDPHGRVVERWRPDDERPEVLADSISWHPDPAVPALEIGLADFFASALD